jgi:predicted ATPase/transcriptional regulator with XRE-family HTH domain
VSVFGQWLKERRKAADLTQAELAERVGCSPIMIAKIESGERRPSKQIAELLARRLNIPPAQVEAFITFARGQTDIAPAPDPAPAPASPFVGLPATALVGRLIGRDREMQQLAECLRDPQTRLVTLTGPGGVGKTQLAVRAAHAARAHFERGVCFVDASTCLNANDLSRAMARALRINEGPDDAVLPVIVACLTRLNLLLALDNLEQVEGAAEVVAELLAHCPRVWMLVTSREALRLRGERVFPVPPLATPITVRGEGASTAELMTIPSVALFVERAQAAAPGFHLDSNNARAVAELCRRLDGLPLALELAAARVSLMTPQALLGRLAPTCGTNAEEVRADEVRIDVIAGDSVELPARQRALRNAIQWSYDLLDPAGQSVFRRLGAFSGSFTLDAAEAVLRAENDNATATWEAVSTQIRHSLLQRRDAGPDGETRFAQLETIRAFARQQLDAAGEAMQTQRWHAAHYLHAAETRAALIAGHAQQDALTRLEADYDNIRAALRWLLQDDPPRGLRLAASLIPFWDVRGYFHEGRQMLEWALSASSAPTADRARALIGLGLFDFNRSAFQSAIRHCDEALSICDSLGDAQGLIAEATTRWLPPAKCRTRTRWRASTPLARASSASPITIWMGRRPRSTKPLRCTAGWATGAAWPMRSCNTATSWPRGASTPARSHWQPKAPACSGRWARSMSWGWR